MAGVNLSEWAIRHRALTIYLMVVTLIAGAYAYMNLGRNEDPPFTIRVMVVQTLWPGATQDETMQQVTDRIGDIRRDRGDRAPHVGQDGNDDEGSSKRGDRHGSEHCVVP